MSLPHLKSLEAALLPHRVETEFLAPDVAQDLLAWTLEAEPRFTAAAVTDYAVPGAVNEKRRDALKLDDLGPFAALFRDALLAANPDRMDGFVLGAFLPRKIEVEMAAHGDGGFFARHVDTLRQMSPGEAQRIVSAVYYFHAQPRMFEGGALRLHEMPMPGRAPRHVDIEPVHNSIVFFPSFVPHEVLPVQVPSKRFADYRFSINFWFNLLD